MAARRFGKEVNADGGRAMKGSGVDQTEVTVVPLTIVGPQQSSGDDGAGQVTHKKVGRGQKDRPNTRQLS